VESLQDASRNIRLVLYSYITGQGDVIYSIQC